MRRIENAFHFTIYFLISLLLPACFEAPKSSDETSSANSSTATKSATITISGAELQTGERSAITTSESEEYELSSQNIDSSVDIVLTLYNTGDVAADKIKAYSLSSPLAYAGGSYPGSGGTCTSKIAGQASCTIVIAFTPNKMGKNSATLQLGYYNGKTTRVFEKKFNGVGISDPTITSVSPSAGRIIGGSTITIVGTQLYSGATVKLGGETCTVTSQTEPTTILCTTPVHTVGSVDLVVTNTDGKIATKQSGYTYQLAPTVTSVSPSWGSQNGGNTLTLTGQRFLTGAIVLVGGELCTSVSIVSSTQLTCLSPVHAVGVGDVTVINLDAQTGTLAGSFTFVTAPTVTSISPTAGALAGGTTVTLTGTGFINGATVSLGGSSCGSVNVVSSTSITCVTTSHTAASVDIVVTNADLQFGTLSSGYTYQAAPSVTSVGPSRIYTESRNILVNGTGFLSGATVTVNGVACTTPVVNSSTSISCIVGANSVGTYSVVVTNVDAQTGTLTNGLTVADNDVWIPTTTTNAPSARNAMQTVWTGSEMIIYGGFWGGYGKRFDPLTGSWTSMTTANVITTTIQAGAITAWTGSKMFLWGGYGNGNSGGRYDPVADTWTAITTTGAPLCGTSPAGDWTGSKLLVWGGVQHLGPTMCNEGGIYDPESNTWSKMTTTNAPTATRGSAGVWTGSKLLVWGGNASGYRNTGYIYDLETDSWTNITTTNAPSARYPGVFFWTGSKLLIWSSAAWNETYRNTGGLYDLASNSWTITSTTGAPVPRSAFTGVWTGGKMLVWGGAGASNTGGIYDLDTNSWTLSTTNGAPSAITDQSLGIGVPVGFGSTPGTDLHYPASVWTGSRMITWGGMWEDDTAVNTGGVYIPPTASSNSWIAMSTTGAPIVRSNCATAWTGSKMLIWGGINGTYFNTGSIFDPVSNSWSEMTTTGAPSPKSSLGKYGVWTGSKFLVWGGQDGGPSVHFLNNGGLYDPETDSWTNISTINAPIGRTGHSVLWTGSKAVVVFGLLSTLSDADNTGGVYDPSTNTWTTMSTTGAPIGTANAAAVWTGSKVITFGGYNYTTGFQNTAGVYDLTANSWTKGTTVNAASSRSHHSFVWTGSKLIVFGGTDTFTSAMNSGGIFDPMANSWTATSTTSTPVRAYHWAVWTGSKMLVWGGVDWGAGAAGALNIGRIYDPYSNTWTAMSSTNAPPNADQFPNVWTGSKWIVWGGSAANTGGIYTP